MANQKTDMTYIVVEDFGTLGRAFVETDERLADRETLLRDLIEGQYDRPVRIVAFSAAAADVSAEIAQAVIDQAWSEGVDLSPTLINFCERHDAEVPEIVHDRAA